MKLPPIDRRKLLMGLVATLGVAYVGKAAFYDRYTGVQREIARLQGEESKLRQLERSNQKLIQQWRGLALRTFGEREADYELDVLVKRLLQESRIEGPDVKPKSSGRLPKTRIARVGSTINARARLDRVVDFLWRVYTEPVLLKVARLRLSPVDATGGGAEVGLEVELESLVFGEDKKAPAVTVRAAAGEITAPPIRVPELGEEGYAAIADRNIFAAFEPPPRVLVKVTNDDRNPIRIRVQPHWQDQPGQAREYEIPGAAKGWVAPEPVEGNRVDVVATYADRTTYKAKDYSVRQRFVTETQTFDVRVPSHSPPPPPTDVDVSVQNKDEAPVEVWAEVEVGGKMVKLAAITVPPGTPVKLDRWESPRLRLRADYKGGGTFGPAEFTPASPRPMLWTVQPKPLETPDDPDILPPPTQPPPAADPNLRVTGLAPVGATQAELVGTHEQTKQRFFYKLGQVVDGGTLIYVHPLGGVIEMPNGEYYLYRLGEKFADRILLSARNEGQLPEALAAVRAERR